MSSRRRSRIGDLLEIGGIEAIGMWCADALAAVIAWRIDRDDPPVAVCSIVAVAVGHRRHAHARDLKRLFIDRARARGAVAVVSELHEDNDAMLGLNVSLGANVERLDDSGYLTCIIPLAQRRRSSHRTCQRTAS